jgi:TRAP transporter 4TM/12TM fusion protein
MPSPKDFFRDSVKDRSLDKTLKHEEGRVEFQSTRYENLPKLVKVIFLVLTITGVALAVIYILGFSFGGRVVITTTGYYYLLFGLFEACAFIILPMRSKDRGRIPWYDLVLAAVSLGIPIYYFLNAYTIISVGWIPAPSTLIFASAVMFCLVMLEGSRRMGGWVFFGLCLFLGLYPLFADHMPGLLYGISYPFSHIISFCVFSGEGIVGMPGRVMGEILIGFLIFAGMLIASGAGDFFLNLAQCLMGRFRGGPAKVAVVSSGFFGSLSGSIISNVVATGSITIPAMKRLGYPPHYAAAVEACASTGGTFMPPVMGVIIFVMVYMTGIDYATIIVAAALPAILYYFGLLLQVDAYAAKVGLKGLPREELPSLKATLKDGWPFLAVLIFLVWGFVYMRWSWSTPYYAAGLLFVLSFCSKKTMLTPRRLINAFVTMGRMIAQTMALVLPFTFILAGLVSTGTSAAFTSGLVAFGEGNIVLILAIGVVACYLLGLMGMDIAAYIFLSVSMAPALIAVGELNVLAVHLFIVYYAMLAAITPPIAIAAFVSAAIAGAHPIKTGLTAMRLGVVIYFIPFFFIFHPVLLLQEGSAFETAYLFILCLVGIMFIAAGLEGYLLKIGKLELWERPLLVLAGLLIAYPGGAQIIPWWMLTFIGAALAAAVIAITFIRRKAVGEKLVSGGW